MTIAIVLLSCNQLHLTNALMSDIRDENPDADIFVVDNGGGYQRQYNEYIIKPPENIRWVRGVNMAIRFALSLGTHYEGIVCLNDDIRLSREFFEGLIDSSSLNPNAGLIAPIYDDVYEHQKGPYRGPAADYEPVGRDDVVSFVDGTAFYIPTWAIELVGILDEENFGRYGWGSDYDYAFRVRDEELDVLVTHRSYINHFHQGSAKFVEDDWSGRAGIEMEEGMRKKYGDDWRSLL